VTALADLIRAWDGETVSAPGALSGVPMEVYHGQPCAGPSISSTGLRTIRALSPAHYWATSSLNPEREEEDQKDHFNLGQAAHMLFLGEQGFTRSFVVRPDTYIDRKTGEEKAWNANATPCKEWLADAKASGRRILTSAQLRQIRGMSRALADCPLVAEHGILNGLIETSLFWQDRETGVWLKARPDVIPIDGAISTDLKTTADAHPTRLDHTLTSFGYHMQIALGGMGLRETLDLRLPDTGGYAFVFIETEAPYGVSIVEVDGEAIYWARRELRAAIRTFADCIEKGRWPAYGDDVRVVGLPKKYRERVEAEAETGALPPDYEDFK
jgi:hypothetical protein